MAEELKVKIGADADGFVKETKRARDEFGRFVKGVGSDAKGAADSFESLRTSSRSLGREISNAFKAIQAANRRGGAGAAFSQLNTEVEKATKNFGTLRGAAGKVGLKALGGAATVALEGFQKLTIATGALSAGLVGIGVKGAQSFAKFETAFAQVETLLPPSFDRVQELETGVRDLAKTFGTDLIESTRAAYQAISQGVGPAETVGFLETAFQAAEAGASSTEQAVTLLLSTLNAFGRPISEATAVSDVFFNTIAKGATTAEELSASIGRIAPIASAAGVSFEEVASGLAALTLGGVSTAEASTQLRNVIAAIVKPSAEAAQALEGIGVNAQLLREQGLEEVFERLRAATGGSLDKLGEFVTGMDGLQGAAALAGGQFENFNKILASNRASLGATSQAASKTGDTLGKSFGRLSATINDAFVSIGRLLSTALGPALDAVTGFVDEAQGEIEILARAFEGEFGAQIEEFFSSLRSESEDTGTVVGVALRGIGDALQTVANFLEENSSYVALLGSAYRTQLAIAEGAIASVSLVAGGLAKALTVLLGVGEAVAAVFSDEVAAGFRQARNLANDLGDVLVDFSADRFVGSFEAFEELPDTFDSIKDGAESAAGTLRSASGAADRLAKSVDAIAASEGQATATQAGFNSLLGQGVEATKQQVAATREVADANAEATTSAADLYDAVSRGALTSEEAADKLNELALAARNSAGAQRELTSALAIFNDQVRIARQAELGRQIESIGITADEVSNRVDRAFRVVDTVLTDRFREAGLSAIRTFAETGEASTAFEQRIRGLEQLQLTFLDPTVFDAFVAAAGGTADVLQSFSADVTDSLRVVSNVLEGEFRKAGDELVVAFANGRVSSREFRAEIENLASLQLGFGELFRDVEDLADGFENLTTQARAAEGALGGELRASVETARSEFEAGTISLEDYLQRIRAAGEASRDFAELSRTQLVVFEQVREENEALGDTILRLADTLQGDLRDSFDDYLEAARQGALRTEDLEKALADLEGQAADTGKETDRLSVSQRSNADAAREATTAQRDYEDSLQGLADAIGLANEQQQLQFNLLAAGRENYFDAATGVRLLNDGQTDLFNSTNRLGAQLDDVGKDKLRLLTDALGNGVISTEQFRSAVKSLAREFGVLASEAESSAARVQQAFAGSNRLSAFGSPGGIQFDSFGQADAGASVFGSFRATGSSNFTSQAEAELGAALGLGPKALRQRIARTPGGISALRDLVGLVDGGAIFSTGAAQVEAGEVVLSQRGLSDFGKLIAQLLNAGRGETIVNQTNNFPISGVTPGGSGQDQINELAFKLQPALNRAGRLAASRSPIR